MVMEAIRLSLLDSSMHQQEAEEEGDSAEAGPAVRDEHDEDASGHAARMPPGNGQHTGALLARPGLPHAHQIVGHADEEDDWPAITSVFPLCA